RPNLITVFGSNFFLARTNHTIPNKGLKIITNSELAPLLTTLGSTLKNSRLECRFSLANRANDPPACSKMAKNKMENKINTSTAVNCWRTLASFSRRNWQREYTPAKGPTTYLNKSVERVLFTMMNSKR